LKNSYLFDFIKNNFWNNILYFRMSKEYLPSNFNVSLAERILFCNNTFRFFPKSLKVS
jgi:hypothetical protein